MPRPNVVQDLCPVAASSRTPVGDAADCHGYVIRENRWGNTDLLGTSPIFPWEYGAINPTGISFGEVALRFVAHLMFIKECCTPPCKWVSGYKFKRWTANNRWRLTIIPDVKLDLEIRDFVVHDFELNSNPRASLSFQRQLSSVGGTSHFTQLENCDASIDKNQNRRNNLRSEIQLFASLFSCFAGCFLFARGWKALYYDPDGASWHKSSAILACAFGSIFIIGGIAGILSLWGAKFC